MMHIPLFQTSFIQFCFQHDVMIIGIPKNDTGAIGIDREIDKEIFLVHGSKGTTTPKSSFHFPKLIGIAFQKYRDHFSFTFHIKRGDDLSTRHFIDPIGHIRPIEELLIVLLEKLLVLLDIRN